MLKQIYPLHHVLNPNAHSRPPFGQRQRRVLDPEQCAHARREIMSWPGYAPTPLRSLSGLARRLGVARLWYKDEAGRFGLGSFKALGGAYAVARVLGQEIERRAGNGVRVDSADLINGRYSEIVRDITVSCATDGNHGRSVAWGAQRFGCRCVIYVHATVSEGRKRAIERFGAEVIRSDGNYDDSVRTAAREAKRHGRIVISDTSYPGYMDIPRYVMQGYTLLADEAIDQLFAGNQQPPTHLFLQAGVGGFAAAVIARFWEYYGDRRPRAVVVDPERAACVYESVRAGKPTAVTGDLDTIMAGLACGEVSLLAWEVLEQGMDDVLTVPDTVAAECMRLLAAGVDGDPPLVAGESAVAGLAGLMLALDYLPVASTLGLNGASRVLLVGTEGATDPELYRRIVGRDAEQVRA